MTSSKKKKNSSSSSKKKRVSKGSKTRSKSRAPPKAKNRGKKGTSNASLVSANSSDPTALIAPEDYEHIYAKLKDGRKPKYKAKGKTSCNADDDDDAPTCLIAPDDYQNLYSGRVDPKAVRPKKVNNPVPDDAPTVLKDILQEEASKTKKKRDSKSRPKMRAPLKAKNKAKKCPSEDYYLVEADSSSQTAPADHARIPKMKVGKKLQYKAKGKTTCNAEDDAPTYLIAPNDYENLYSAKCDPRKEAQPKKEDNPIPDDAPTVLKMIIQKEANEKSNQDNSNGCECCCLIM